MTDSVSSEGVQATTGHGVLEFPANAWECEACGIVLRLRGEKMPDRCLNCGVIDIHPLVILGGDA